MNSMLSMALLKNIIRNLLDKFKIFGDSVLINNINKLFK